MKETQERQADREDNQTGVSSSLSRRVFKRPTVRWGAHKSFQDRRRANEALGDWSIENRHG
jgi:hypothetical protein